MSNLPTPALTKSILYLRDSINKGIWPYGSRIPSYLNLAEEAQVSGRTMLKALKILEVEGLLYSRRKRGIIIGKPPSAIDRQKKQSVNKWQVIKSLLHNDIVTGVFHDQAFIPSVKELMGFYETGFTVIKKAIDALVKEQVLYPHKRTYRIEHFVATASSRKTICFIATERVLSGIAAEYEATWVQSFVRALEKECSIKNLLLEKRLFTGKTVHHDKALEPVLGFIFWFSSDILGELPSGKEVIDFFSFLSAYKQPIAVFNLAGVREFEIYSNCIKPGIVRCPVFLSDYNRDYQAGVKVGRFLAGKGYSKACFFAPDHTHLYVNERFRGLTDAFSSAGVENAVTPFYLSNFTDGSPNQSAPAPMLYDVKTAGKLNVFTSVTTMLKQEMATSKFHEDRVISHIAQLQEWLEFRRMFMPLFHKALSMHSRCAWICSNDALAIYAAMGFLHDKKTTTSATIGLVGFDDTNAALLNSLTSYHFDFSATARRIINLIIYSKNSARFLDANRENPGVYEVDGVVIDRGSV